MPLGREKRGSTGGQRVAPGVTQGRSGPGLRPYRCAGCDALAAVKVTPRDRPTGGTRRRRGSYTIILTKGEVQPSPCPGSGHPSLHLWSNAHTEPVTQDRRARQTWTPSKLRNSFLLEQHPRQSSERGSVAKSRPGQRFQGRRTAREPAEHRGARAHALGQSNPGYSLLLLASRLR